MGEVGTIIGVDVNDTRSTLLYFPFESDLEESKPYQNQQSRELTEPDLVRATKILEAIFNDFKRCGEDEFESLDDANNPPGSPDLRKR